MSETEVVCEWFRINEMTSNSDLIGAENEHRLYYISNLLNLVKPLGLWIDNKLTLKEHIKTLLKKVIKDSCPIKSIRLYEHREIETFNENFYRNVV